METLELDVMNYLFRNSCYLLVVGLTLAISANAQEQDTAIAPLPEIPSNVGILSHIEIGEFEPGGVFALREHSLGKIKRYKGSGTMIDRSENKAIVVGAPVPAPKTSENREFHYALFSSTADSGLRTIAVEKLSAQQLKLNSPSFEQLTTEIAALERAVQTKSMEKEALIKRYLEVKDAASKVVDVDKIVELKQKISSLENSRTTKTEEIERLKELVDSGRRIHDPEDIDKQRQELSQHLMEAAEVTSMTDRLSRRKREAAKQNFQQKIKIIREMDSVDMQAMAQEALSWRKKRRGLEQKLGLGAGGFEEEEF